MKISEEGIKLIKQFEGCRLTAYADAVGVMTIGYGHTAGVKAGMKITQEQADEYLRKDIAKFEKAVDALKMDFNINQFSALVSFSFNCGTGSLKTLCSGRTKAEIASKMLLYNKAGGKVLAGLTRRRKAENALYNKQCEVVIYQPPTTTLKEGSKGSGVKWLQQALSAKGFPVAVDGVFGKDTEKAVKNFQKQAFVDGIVGELTRKELLK